MMSMHQVKDHKAILDAIKNIHKSWEELFIHSNCKKSDLYDSLGENIDGVYEGILSNPKSSIVGLILYIY